MPSATRDAVIDAALASATADSDCVSLILSGSRGAGCADPESDYDLLLVLTDAAYDARRDRSEPLQVKRETPEGRVDLSYSCPRELARVALEPGWWSAGYAGSRLLLDKTGAIEPLIRAIAALPEEKAAADAGGWFDAYLNAFYRSLKAWRRGDELGARLQAAESMMHLVKTLFSLERRWPPYHDRLLPALQALAAQGWPAGYLEQVLLAILRTGSPSRQQELEEKVEALMRERGYGHVVAGWGGDIERARAFQFEM